jgi:hypothetical protein
MPSIKDGKSGAKKSKKNKDGKKKKFTADMISSPENFRFV